MSDQPFVIAEVIYPGLTQLDFTGPHTILSRLPNAQAIVASPAGGDVRTDCGLTFAGTKPIADVERCDLLFFPGGLVTTQVINDLVFMDQVRRLASGAQYLTSVCTGSLILAAAGLLRGRRAACHWAMRDMLSLFGATPDPARVVRDGNIITGGGVTAGIDFALTVAAELAGEDFAQAIQLTLEYAPAPPFNSGRPETAPPHILALSRQRFEKLMPTRLAEAQRAAERLLAAAS
jgi:transcriptional regulator GlxA family with amidase domain